jgi:hypothetical protein
MSRYPAPARTLHVDATRFRSCPSPDRLARLRGDVLQLVLTEGTGARELLQAIDWSGRWRGGRSRLLTLGVVEFLGIALTSLALMITLGVFDIFGNAMHHVVGSLLDAEAGAGAAETRREQLLLLGSMAAIFAGLTMVRMFRRVPLFEENVESVSHAVRMAFDDFFNSDSHLRGALRARLRRAGIGRVRGVEIWNANAGDSLGADGRSDAAIWQILLPALLDSLGPTANVVLLVRSDEYDAVARKVAERLPGVRTERCAVTSGSLPGAVLSPALMPPAEREWLPLLRLAAFPAVPLTADTLRPDAVDHVFSEAYFINLLTAVRGDDPQRARLFLLRCRLDYGVLVDAGDDRYAGLHREFMQVSSAAAMAPLRAAIQHALIQAPQSFVEAHDPLCHLAVVNGLCAAADARAGSLSATEAYRLKQLILAVVADFLACVERTERYDMLKHFFGGDRSGNLKALAGYLPAVVGPGSDSGIAGQVREEVRQWTRFNAFRHGDLMRLGRLHEVIGNYADALAVWRKLEAVDGRRARVRIARLSERAGNFAAAAGEITGAIEELERRSPAVAGTSALLAVETYLEGAWVILSAADAGQREECRRRLDQAGQWLERLDEVAEPPVYWRYYNYLGLFHDWLQAYPEALGKV